MSLTDDLHTHGESGPDHPILQEIGRLAGQIVDISPDSGMEDTLENQLDILERMVEMGRLITGRIENDLGMDQLLKHPLFVDPESRRIAVGAARLGRDDIRTAAWASETPRVPHELQIPLLLHLLQNRDRMRPIRHLLSEFVEQVKPFLSPLDVESTKTGVPRIATNTRLAAHTLRTWGLIRSSRPVKFKTWELTHLGLIIGMAFALDGHKIQLTPPTVRTSGKWLAIPIRVMMTALEDPHKLRDVLSAVCRVNADILNSMSTILDILRDYGELITPPASGPTHLRERQAEAANLLERIQQEIPSDQLADDVVVDLALRDVLELD